MKKEIKEWAEIHWKCRLYGTIAAMSAHLCGDPGDVKHLLNTHIGQSNRDPLRSVYAHPKNVLESPGEHDRRMFVGF